MSVDCQVIDRSRSAFEPCAGQVLPRTEAPKTTAIDRDEAAMAHRGRLEDRVVESPSYWPETYFTLTNRFSGHNDAGGGVVGYQGGGCQSVSGSSG